MPFIHVKSLPFEQEPDMRAVVQGITEDFARDTGIGHEHVTATWEFIRPGLYAVAGRGAESQQRATHPVLVDLLAPDFNGPEAVERMMKSAARSIAARTGVPLANVFVNFRQAHAGQVLDSGEVVRW